MQADTRAEVTAIPHASQSFRLYAGTGDIAKNLEDAWRLTSVCQEKRVVRVLERLVWCHGKPDLQVLDNGPEFAGKALLSWSEEQGIFLDFITPGKPMENAICESLVNYSPRSNIPVFQFLERGL